MKKIAFFCIPAHGHTNPMLLVAAELVKRGDAVRFYSFNEFETKIKATGAEFISCDSYLPKLTEQEELGLKNVSTTEMTIQDIRITLNMNVFIDKEFNTSRPDVVYTDSVCFWGKLNAWKYDIPLVVSTSTFAFNCMSSQYMKNSPREIADLIFGLPRVSRELNKLKAYGFKFKSLFSLVQSDNDTDSVVYTSKYFQPYSESFSSHYLFVGPSVLSEHKPKKTERPLVYVSMGTVINDRPDFYSKCIDAMRGEAVDMVISCGDAVDAASLGELPKNVKVFPYVNQLEILSKASVFITHCGMNSVSESLYMETPMVLYPQTNEQAAVARRVTEIGAGIRLKDDSADGIREAVHNLIKTEGYAKAAQKCAEDFRNSPGIEGAADFIENAPYKSSGGIDVIKKLNKANVLAQVIYNIVSVLLAILIFQFVSTKFIWIYVVLIAILGSPFRNWAQNVSYKWLIRKYNLG